MPADTTAMQSNAKLVTDADFSQEEALHVGFPLNLQKCLQKCNRYGAWDVLASVHLVGPSAPQSGSLKARECCLVSGSSPPRLDL
jgi:hypothetical protein